MNPHKRKKLARQKAMLAKMAPVVEQKVEAEVVEVKVIETIPQITDAVTQVSFSEVVELATPPELVQEEDKTELSNSKKKKKSFRTE